MAEYTVTKYQFFTCRGICGVINKTALLSLLFSLLSLSNAQWYWQPGGTTATLFGVSFSDANTGTAVGEDGTILRTTNGGMTWYSQTSGTTNMLFGVSFTDANTGTVVGYYGTILRTTNGGTTWTQQTSGTTAHYGVSFADVNIGTTVGIGGEILRTTNGGASWTSQTSGTIWALLGVSFIDQNIGTAVGGGGTILRTTNGGTIWTLQTSGTTHHLHAVSFSGANTGTAVGELGTILRTTSGGTTWTSQSSGTNLWLYGVSFSDGNTGTVVGEYGTILRTTNGGTTWTLQTSGTTNILYGVSFTDANTGTAVGIDGTILRTTNGGIPVELTSFEAIPEGNNIKLTWSTATELNNKGFYIEKKKKETWEPLAFISGHGTTSEIQNYTYTDNLSDLEGLSKVYYRLKQVDYDGSFEYSKEIEATLTFVSDYSLSQNYPNPFNPSTTISYSIPVQGKVRLIVYDALGSEVRKLVDEEKDAGKYEIEFNADGLASGMYFYRLSAGEGIATKKMIYLK